MLAIPAFAADIYVNQTHWWDDGGVLNSSITPIQAAINNASNSNTTSRSYTGPAAPKLSSSGSSGRRSADAFNVVASQYKYIQNVKQGIALNVTFENTSTPITGVSFIPLIQPARHVEFRVQALKQRSASVSVDPPGKVFIYMNIICDLRTSKELKDVKLQFVVPDEWFSDNGINPSEVALYRWSNDKWNQLPTTQTNENDWMPDKINMNANGMYYTALTPGFSTFAISTKSVIDGVQQPVSGAGEYGSIKVGEEASFEEVGAQESENEKKEELPGFSVLTAVGGIMCLAYLMRKREDE
ncbi:MAG: PGF-pre-PGF domain-containing protein [Methanosarcinaceae archaeon]|nr:PGF-pre-PGF domain-containing protein [Methanosarcinaceae archaeon]